MYSLFKPAVFLSILFINAKIKAQTPIHYSFDAGLELGRDLNSGNCVRLGADYEIGEHWDMGVRTGFDRFGELKKTYVPICLSTKYFLNKYQLFFPYIPVEAGYGFYNEEKLKGGPYFFAGGGLLYDPGTTMAVSFSGGLSAFGFSPPGTHYFSKKLTFRLGLVF
jgi:hypothetical protein